MVDDDEDEDQDVDDSSDDEDDKGAKEGAPEEDDDDAYDDDDDDDSQARAVKLALQRSRAITAAISKKLGREAEPQERARRDGLILGPRCDR